MLSTKKTKGHTHSASILVPGRPRQREQHRESQATQDYPCAQHGPGARSQPGRVHERASDQAGEHSGQGRSNLQHPLRLRQGILLYRLGAAGTKRPHSDQLRTWHQPLGHNRDRLHDVPIQHEPERGAQHCQSAQAPRSSELQLPPSAGAVRARARLLEIHERDQE